MQVIAPGQLNHNQGPDFLDARVRIGNTLLAGNIELHLHEADWSRHSHTFDPNYKNIILHVLWELPGQQLLPLPTIALKERISKMLLQRYDTLMQSQAFVPCAGSLQEVTALTWAKWKERLVAERLLRKSALAQQYLLQSHQHWEEVFWWMLARNFGIPINAEPFEAVARSLPLTLLARHRNRLPQLEALLLGQAGLLDKPFKEDYARMLAEEYRFLQTKYDLEPIPQQVHFLRMRPGNFPTIRLAQLAMLLHTAGFLFSMIKESSTVKDLYSLLHVTAGEYWNTHYVPDETAVFRKKSVGFQMVENIIINTIVPLLFAYGHVRNEQPFKDKAITWMEQLAPEKNAVTNAWTALDVENHHAWDSQALLELKKEYCDTRRCLECPVGTSLLNVK